MDEEGEVGGGWWVGGLMERQRWETEGRKRGGRYSHVINDKWWQSVGGGGGAGRLHGSLPAERLLLGGGGGRGGRHTRDPVRPPPPPFKSKKLLSSTAENGQDKSIFSAPQIWFV